MGVSTMKLWNSRRFKKLSPNAMLLYIYFTTTPIINYLGVVCQSPEDISVVTKLNLPEIRKATRELIEQKDLMVIKVGVEVFFIVPAHFSTVSKADTTLSKIKSNLAELPQEVRDLLDEIGINPQEKRKIFNKPTELEVLEYSLSQGYYVDPEYFINFYNNNPKSTEEFWYDAKGKIVSDWRAKIRNVWSKRAKVVTFPDNAPEGYELLYVLDNGEVITADYWKDGQPFSKNFIHNTKIKKEYDRRKADS